MILVQINVHETKRVQRFAFAASVLHTKGVNFNDKMSPSVPKKKKRKERTTGTKTSREIVVQ